MKTYRLVLLWLFFFGCTEKYSAEDNQAYLRSIGAVVVKYHQTTGSLPISIDECLTRLSITLPHRGDVSGKTLVYNELTANSFMLRSVGSNGIYEYGKGDDLDIFFLNRKEVTRDEILKMLREKRPNDDLWLSILFGPELLE